MKRSQLIKKKYTDELLWNVVKSFMLQHKFLVKHHLDSYNHFIKHDIKEILKNIDNVFFLKQYGNKIYKNVIEFEDIRITDPSQSKNKQDIIITPQIARQNNLTYESKLYVNAIQRQYIIDIYNDNEQVKEINRKEIILANIPVMIYSDLCILNNEKYKRKDCKYDNGGYFIVKGSEKMCVSQERLAYNRLYILKKTFGDAKEFVAEVTSPTTDNKYKLTTIQLNIKKNNIITVSLPIFKNTIHIPVIILIYLCGIHSDEEILNLILQDMNKDLISEFINPFFQNKSILDKSFTPLNSENMSINIETIYAELKNFINKDIFGENQSIQNIDKIYIKHELKHNLLPFLGTNLIKKGKYLCYMVNRLIFTAIGQLELSDRDNYINKRLETTGEILGHVFNYSLKTMFKECENIFRKRVSNNLTAILKPPSAIEFLKLSTFDKEFKSAFTIGEIKSLNRSGVFHVYKQVSYVDSLAHSRMVRTPVGGGKAVSKLIAPRYVHPSQFGYICPVESPEGKNIGLVKFLANTSIITLSDSKSKNKLLNILDKLIIPLDSVEHYDTFLYNRVFCDGDWIGYTKDIFDLRSQFINLRRNGVINNQFSIRVDYNTKELHIQTDQGRFIRPLLIVNNFDITLPPDFIEVNKDWIHYEKSKYIEYIDIEESSTLLIALHFDYINKNKYIIQNKRPHSKNELKLSNYDQIVKKYTHCEIHQLAILGVVSSSLPFQNHNQAPKDTSTCKYIKQAVCMFNPSFRERFDKQALIMHYSQKPLVGTKIHEIIKINELPTGQNAIVALACYSGYNQEDSVIVNQSAVDRGAFGITYYKSYEAKLQKNINTGKNDIFFKPNPLKVNNVKKANYNKLNDNGFISEETQVKGYDAIIGKLTPVVENTADMDKLYNDTSTILKVTETGIIDKVVNNIYDHENNEMCKVRIRSERKTNVGDKFCYDINTEILTFNGWKFFKDLKYSDKIATLQHGFLEYSNPTEIIEFPYNGEMIKLSSRFCNYCVTPNHRLYTKEKNKFVLKEASELYRKSKIFKTKSNYKGKKCLRTNLRLYFQGILVSLGIFRTNKIYISSKYSDQIQLLCKKLNVKHKITNGYIIIDSLSINSLFPKWLWLLSSTKIRYFINGIFQKKSIFKTKNKNIINNIQQSIIHAGYQSKVSLIKNIYTIYLIKDNIHYRNNSNVENKIFYNDKVYCCTSKTGIICVRRNGITMWNGNSSRMGQKGTVGIMLRQEDMPFTKDGIVPDIIMNPHAIPTRMSMGQILECVLGKIAAIEGHDIDGTSFNQIDVDNFPKILKKYGYDEMGIEEMRCGFTGKKLKSKIFIGPTYYQRLKHMAEDKIHARGGDGPTSILTRDPPKGRAQGGGLRIGEMERDCFIAHGMSLFLKEKMVDSIKKYIVHVCDKCGVLAHKKLNSDLYICPLCNNEKFISKVSIPYNMKLLMQELMSIGIKPTLELFQDKYNY